MSTFLIVFLIVAASSLEILLSSLDASWGLAFALASFTLTAIDPSLFLLALSLLALHIFFVSVRSLRNLAYTAESRRRQGFIEAQKQAHQIYLQQSLKSLMSA